MSRNKYTFLLLFFVGTINVASADAQYISTVAGTSAIGYSGDGGPAVNATFNGCSGIAVDGAGNIYIADNGNNVVRRIDPSGTISTFAGTGVAGYSGNGGLAILAKLNSPSAVATDASGNVYIADKGNNTVRVVNTSGVIKNFAGNGIAGFSGNGDTAHLGTLNAPLGIAFDQTGNLFIADAGNNAIRKVSVGDRLLSTVAGTGAQGYSGDGGAATNAKLYSPSGVATDVSGNLYIADILNNVVRKVNSLGEITTFAGTGVIGNSGNGSAAVSAALKYPSSITVDNSGNIYIADQGNNNVRQVNAAGVISNVAGTTVSGYEGDGGLAINAKLASPKCVFADGWGRLYIADYNNHVIRVINGTAGITNNTKINTISIYPNPTNQDIQLAISGVAGNATVTVCDVTGKIVLNRNVIFASGKASLAMNDMISGLYSISVGVLGNVYTGKVLVNSK